MKQTLVNNTFGGPTYLDGKLLVYAPGQDGAEVTFYLNGIISLNTSDTIYYHAGDVRCITLSSSGSTTELHQEVAHHLEADPQYQEIPTQM